MTDEHDDELASAYLDDEVTPDERARVEGDAELLARVDALRAARDALAAEPIETPPDLVRERAVRAAGRASTIVDLRARRLRIASIAAAILVALGITGALLLTTGDSSNNHFAAVGGSLGTTTTSPPQMAAGAMLRASPASLGSFTDRASLVEATRAAVDQPKESAPTAAADAAGGAAGPSCAPTESSTFTAFATFDDRPVRVDVVQQPDGSRRMQVTDLQTCAPVFTQTL